MNQPAKDHAFVLRALLAAAHIVTSIAAVEARLGSINLSIDLACYTLALSQISLAGIWVVMGRSLTVVRWSALIALFGLWLPLLWRPFEDNYLLLNGMAWQAAALIVAMLAMHWRGLRMINILSIARADEVEPASKSATGTAPRQFHLEHLFLLTTIVAACVGAGRFLNLSSSAWRMTLLLGLANAAVATATCWAMFSTRNFLTRLALLLVVVPLAAAALCFGLGMYRWPFVVLSMLHCLVVAVSLWIFRLCGFRLVHAYEL
jgi:predicted secreted protein